MFLEENINRSLKENVYLKIVEVTILNYLSGGCETKYFQNFVKQN